MNRLRIYLILTLIPLILFWARIWYIDPNRTIHDVPISTPKWVEKSSYGTCSAAITGTQVTNLLAPINSVQAARIASKVIETQTDLYTISGQAIVPFTPVMVERQFPDNQKHVAWAYGEARITDNHGMNATVEVVYIDAMTGDALLLIKDLFAADPSFTCPQINNSTLLQMLKPLQQTALYVVAVALSLIYLVVVAIIGFRWFRHKPSPETASANIPTSVS